MKKWAFILLLLLPCCVRSQTITTYVNTSGIYGYSGDGGLADTAKIAAPVPLNFDNSGNLLIGQADLIRKVDKLTTIITTIAGSDTASSLGHGGDGGPATCAAIIVPFGICVDKTGNLYIADNWFSEIRKVTLSTSIIDTFAGNRIIGSVGDGGLAKNAQINGPFGICFDTAQHYLYICDAGNHKIRRVDMSNDTIGAFAGTGINGYGGDGSPAINAKFSRMLGICMDANNNLYIGDWDNHRIRRVDGVTGIVTTIAGNGTGGFSGDGGAATVAELQKPTGICFDKCGNLYFTDEDNNCVRRVDISNGTINTIAGNGIAGFGGDGGPAMSASFNHPTGIAIDSSGNLYISDYYNNRVRKMTFPDPFINISIPAGDSTCVGTPVTIYAAIGAGGTAPSFQWSVNGSVVSSTGSSYTYTPANGDNVSCILTSNSGCVGTPTVVSNTLHIATISASATPSVSISESATSPLCAGTPVVFTATPSYGGASPVFHWSINSILVTSTGSVNTYTYTPANGDNVSCTLTSSIGCLATTTANSNSFHFTVIPVTTPTVSIAASPTGVLCSGTSVLFTAAAFTGTVTPSYQWLVDGHAVGSSLGTYTYTPANGDSVRCIVTSSEACATPPTVSSNSLHMSVIPSVTPSVSISSSASDTICAGTGVLYTASPSSGGSGPVYHWLVDGALVSVGTTTYSYIPVNGDSIRFVLISNAACATTPTVTSNTIDMVVVPYTTPAVVLTGTVTTIVGGLVTINATVTGAGSNYSINWYNNGIYFTNTPIPTLSYIKAAGTDNITATVIPVSASAATGCYDSVTSAVHTVTVMPTGVNNTVTEQSLHIYPNPVNDVLHIDGVTTQTQYCLFSVVGAAIRRDYLRPGDNSISLQSMPAGVYMLEITNSDGEKQISKVIKQ